MKPIEIQTENFKCEAKKVGTVQIGTEELPVYDCSTIPKTYIIFGYEEDEIPDDYGYGDEFEDEEYEQESLNLVKKLLDELEKDNPFFLAFISSDINRCAWGIAYWDQENPVKGFMHVWGEYGWNWQTWVESAVVANNREKDIEFQITFEKWALAKFLKLLFREGYADYGYLSVGKLNVVHRWSKVADWTTDLPIDYVVDILPNRSLTEEELEQLYGLLTQR